MPSLPLLALTITGLVTIQGLLVIAALHWVRKRRKTRWPFKKSERLLREPGETLRKKVLATDERFAWWFFGGAAGTVLTFFSVRAVMEFPAGSAKIAVPILSALGVAVLSAWRIARLARQRTWDFQGWYGERMVADQLLPLARDGYHVFHDVPAEGATKDFNLDHVAVGRTGVVLVETKTHAKLKESTAQKGYVVKFDGEHLIWPWGREKRSIAQVTHSARWLSEWIAKRTDLKVSVRAFITVPGWEVDEAFSKTLRVVKPDRLRDAIHGHGERVLTDEQVKLIALQLNLVCRDVED